jgi:hypothetical protein
MTIDRLAQGQSDYTRHKQEGLKSLLHINMRRVKPFMTKCLKSGMPQFPYFRFDLNSGSGYNDEEKVVGSPLVFLQTALAEQINYRAFFCDINRDSCEELVGRVGHNEKAYVFWGDNRSFVEMIPEIIKLKPKSENCNRGESPKFAMGSVYVDPNGPSGLMVDELKELFDVCERLDLIINLSATGLKRTKSLSWSMRVSELMSKINKKQWVVRQIYGAWQWTLLFGSNLDKPLSWKAKGFVPVNSYEGQDILNRMDMTADEYQEFSKERQGVML